MPVDIEYNRQSLRLPGRDYSTEGSYFITICTDEHVFHFGAVFNDQMVLNEIGLIVKAQWYKLSDRFSFIHLGPFCVMPNHIHGIINITSPYFSSSTNSFNGFIPVGAGLAPAREGESMISSSLSNVYRAGASPAPTEESNQGKIKKITLGNIVGVYKSLVMKECLSEHKAKFMSGTKVPYFGKIWQRNYYEHIIRTQESFDTISAYILTNPQNWTKDKFYIKFV
ncbi:MAG: hypothetical protein D4R64_15445 [Porphyromonadaceae bacterium]|nr:MAG: hypothetical protein D4R64_15445 [Porphyromonadaceae bacterium]